MKEKQNQYYMFALSNFIAAFGGGTILGKGINIINLPYLQGGSILSFFIGTVLGLVFLQSIPKNLSKSLSKWLSIFGSISSCALVAILMMKHPTSQLSGEWAVVFFMLLSIRFSFWLYSRVIRASSAAGNQHNIAWVELGYCSGIILGLIVWDVFQLNVSLILILLLDAILQFVAGILDRQGNKKLSSKMTPQEQAPPTVSTTKSVHSFPVWNTRLIIAVTCLTISIQVVTFNLAHQQATTLGVYLMAVFYFAAANAALVYKKFNLFLDWNGQTHYSNIYSQNIKFNLFWLILLSGCCVMLAVIGMHNINHISNAFIYTFIFLAAFLYEIIALAIIDRIGLEDNQSSSKGIVMRTYGFMGIGAALSLWILTETNSTYFGLIFTIIACVIVSSLSMRRRKMVI